MPEETEKEIVVTFSKKQIDTLITIIAIAGMSMTEQFEKYHKDPEFIKALEDLAELGIKLSIAEDVEFTS